VVLDVVGGDYLARNLDALAVGGRIVQVGVMADAMATFPLGALLPKRATLVGTVLRLRPLEEKIAVTQQFAARCCHCSTPGCLARSSTRRFRIDQIADAHRYMESNANVGKIVIDL
jgi:NADPH:quinone reductase